MNLNVCRCRNISEGSTVLLTQVNASLVLKVVFLGITTVM